MTELTELLRGSDTVQLAHRVSRQNESWSRWYRAKRHAEQPRRS